MNYVIKMDGEKIRLFNDRDKAVRWARLYCHSDKVTIVAMRECNGLPRASKPIHPNLDTPELRYKPFVSLA